MVWRYGQRPGGSGQPGGSEDSRHIRSSVQQRLSAKIWRWGDVDRKLGFTCIQFIASFCFEKRLDIEVDLVEVWSDKVYSATEIRVKGYRRCRSRHDAV